MKIPDDVNWSQLIADLSALEASVIRWGNHWESDLLDLVQNGHRIYGDRMPWTKTQDLVRFRHGELTIWGGINGHRKSMLIGQCLLWVAKHSKVCIASLEMKPEETMLRMCRQAAGCFPSQSFARQFSAWTEERICIYDQLDTVEVTRIYALIYYAARDLGCKHIVIDSMSKCGFADDDYAAEKKFVDKLQWLAKTLRVHVHLVCHIRKGMSEDRVPNKFDIKGTGGITDLADNVIIVWKDKRKEQAAKKRAANMPLSGDEMESLERPDQKLIVEKQRHGQYEGGFSLWFDESSLQFIPSEGGGPLPFYIDENQSESREVVGV